ncbi:exported protein (hyp11), partial [Plasmodium reichenowi]
SYTFINVTILLFLTLLLFLTYCNEYYYYDAFSNTKFNNNIKIGISIIKRIIA